MTTPDTKAQFRGLVEEQAAEVLRYYQRAYAFDSAQAAAAEGTADILVSGDVGLGRRFEALDWYYKAATGYIAWKMPPDTERQQTTRVLEKMAAIDRENPLTKKLEAQVYK